MRKIKMHLFSISIIILMLILGLGTSYGVKTRIDIANNSSNNIRLKITINDLIRLYNEDGNNLWKYDIINYGNE